MFVHVHDLRVQRVEQSAPERLNGLVKFAKNDAALDKQRLRQVLEQSGEAMAQLIGIGLEKGTIKSKVPTCRLILPCPILQFSTRPLAVSF